MMGNINIANTFPCSTQTLLSPLLSPVWAWVVSSWKLWTMLRSWSRLKCVDGSPAVTLNTSLPDSDPAPGAPHHPLIHLHPGQGGGLPRLSQGCEWRSYRTWHTTLSAIESLLFASTWTWCCAVQWMWNLLDKLHTYALQRSTFQLPFKRCF